VGLRLLLCCLRRDPRLGGDERGDGPAHPGRFERSARVDGFFQRLVDRRFNRARYDAEATVTAFRMRLREAVDLDTVQRELLRAADRAVEPAHTSLWIRPSGARSRP